MYKTLNVPIRVKTTVQNAWIQTLFVPRKEYILQGWITPDGSLLQVSERAISRSWLVDSGAEIQLNNGEWVPLNSNGIDA